MEKISLEDLPGLRGTQANGGAAAIYKEYEEVLGRKRLGSHARWPSVVSDNTDERRLPRRLLDGKSNRRQRKPLAALDEREIEMGKLGDITRRMGV